MADDRKYGTLDYNPCMFDDREAWVLHAQSDGWTKVPLTAAVSEARQMTKEEFNDFFRYLPALPKEAFRP